MLFYLEYTHILYSIFVILYVISFDPLIDIPRYNPSLKIKIKPTKILKFTTYHFGTIMLQNQSFAKSFKSAPALALSRIDKLATRFFLVTRQTLNFLKISKSIITVCSNYTTSPVVSEILQHTPKFLF